MKINADVRVISTATEIGWYGTAISLLREIRDANYKIRLVSYYPEYIENIRSGTMQNKQVMATLKKKKIANPLDVKIWGMLSQIKHAEPSWVWAYGDFSRSPIGPRFTPIVNDYLIDAVYGETCWWIIAVTERMRFYILSKYNGEFTKCDYSSEWCKLYDLVIQMLTILKSKTL